ncbi:MAG: response regulator [Anaerolineae bacterium]
MNTATVLVVDDDPDFCEVTRLILSSEGYEVLTAASGDEALGVLKECHPNLVMLDVMMASILDGVNVALTMSEDTALRDIPILMVSSIASSPMAERFPTGEYLPISGWISKPVQPESLLKTVRKLVGGAA